MPDDQSANRQAIKDNIGKLGPEAQRTLLAEVVRTSFSPEVRKEIASQATQALPNELQKDAVTEATQTLPTEAKKEIASEVTQALPAEVKKDFVTRTVQDLPQEDKKDIAVRAFQDLSAKDKQDVAGNPSQYVTDQIWLTIVRTFAAVLVASALGLLFVSIWPPESESNPTQVLLPVFTSIAGILAGFISGRASAGG